MKIKLLIPLMMVFIIFSCKPSKNKSIEKINILEKEILSVNAKIDSTKANQLIDLYIDYADNFKDDSIAPHYLFKAANVSLSVGKYEKSVSLLDRTCKDYSNFKKLPDCIFLKAFIYENMLHDLKKANEIYNEFISKFPDNDMVPSAKAAIENLGVPVEDLIKNFEEKNSKALDTIKA